MEIFSILYWLYMPSKVFFYYELRILQIVQLLHAWSIEYPKESKFKVAYDMLKTQGVVKETPPPLPAEGQEPLPPRARNAIFEDEEKSKLLQKLLQSKKPEDLQHANRLIKTMVREVLILLLTFICYKTELNIG